MQILICLLKVWAMIEQYVTLIIKIPVYASLKQWIYNFCAFIAKLVCRNFAEKFGSSNPPAQKKMTFWNSGAPFGVSGIRKKSAPLKPSTMGIFGWTKVGFFDSWPRVWCEQNLCMFQAFSNTFLGALDRKPPIKTSCHINQYNVLARLISALSFCKYEQTTRDYFA